MLLLLALACIETGLEDETKEPTPGEDTGVDCPPTIPDCNDTDPPEDTEPPDETDEPEYCGEQYFAGEIISQVEECYVEESTGSFTPEVEWKKSSWTTEASSNNIMMTPIVVSLNDDDGDGDIDEDDVPDIIVVTYGGTGTMRAVSGDGSGEIWNVTGESLQGQGALAAGDIDGDGLVEICGATSNTIKCFENDGTLKWTSSSVSGLIYGTSDAPAISDMDGDGDPEIICGSAILNNDGTIRGRGSHGIGSSSNVGTTSFAVDLENDGEQEVITGNAAYDPDGNTLWYNGEADGYVAVADVDGDGEGEVIVTGDGKLRVQDSDGTVLCRATIAGAGGSAGGPPTVADFDGDGEPEIGVAATSTYTVFEADCSQIWQNTTQDSSSGNTGSAVFDFEGDGVAEAVYADETRLWVFAGPDGSVKLESTEHSNATWTEYAIVADVDGDDQAEIVVPNTNYTGHTGFYVFGDADESWRAGRKIWNQHAYHITNVNDDGSIPATADLNWLDYNNFRSGDLTAGSGGAYSDLIVQIDDVCEVECDRDTIEVWVRVGNQGYLDVEDEVELVLWAQTSDGPRVLGKETVTATIPAGERLEGIHFEITGINPDWTIQDLKVTIDDGNSDESNANIGLVDECDEENDEDEWGVPLCL